MRIWTRSGRHGKRWSRANLDGSRSPAFFEVSDPDNSHKSPEAHKGGGELNSEVMRDALRSMEQQDLLKKLSVSSSVELESKLMASIARFERGEGIKGEEAFRKLRQRIGDKRSRG